uniref:hypothetical protein n=2 Tax=Escherichia coli TaxID=562 RepID=UPI00201ADB04
HTNRPLTDFGGKTSIFSHPVYLFLREFSLQDFRGGSIRAKLDSLVTAGKLIGAECWYDVVDNSTTDLRQGRVRIRYKYTPVPPLEDMELYQTFTDEYFEPAFAVLGGA